MNIIKTCFPVDLHLRLKKTLLDHPMFNSSESISNDILVNRKIENSDYAWIINDIEKWILRDQFEKIISYNVDYSFHSMAGEIVEWHTDSSPEDNDRLSQLPEDEQNHKTLVYYPLSNDSCLEFDDFTSIDVRENTVVIFNSNQRHRVWSNSGNSRRVALTYMFLKN